jgi:hypothetical protein
MPIKKIQPTVRRIQKQNNGKIGLLLTLVLPIPYHRYVNEINYSYYSNTKIGYEVLQKSSEDINIRIADRFKKTPHIRIAEPHYDLALLFHILYWIEEENYDELEKIITKEIKRIQGLDKLGKQCDIKKIDNEDNTFAMKYMSKKIIDTRHLSDWYKFHDMRRFAHSKGY